MFRLTPQTSFCDLSPSCSAWHYQERFGSSVFVAAHQVLLVASLSLRLVSRKSGQIQLPWPLLVSYELVTSCHFGSPPLHLLQFLPLLLQLEPKPDTKSTDGMDFMRAQHSVHC